MAGRAVLCLAASAWTFWMGVVALRFLGRVLLTLAGLGRMKVNSKVPPTVRPCGATPFGNLADQIVGGLSPRGRGANRPRAFHRVNELGGRPLGRGNPRDSFPVIPLTSLSWPACGVSHPSEPAGLS